MEDGTAPTAREGGRSSAALTGGGGTPLSWMERGRCVGTRGVEFFPDRGQRAAPAKAVCTGCVVRLTCLAYAVQNEIVDGVWGGFSPQERMDLMAKLRTQEPSPQLLG